MARREWGGWRVGNRRAGNGCNQLGRLRKGLRYEEGDGVTDMR